MYKCLQHLNKKAERQSSVRTLSRVKCRYSFRQTPLLLSNAAVVVHPVNYPEVSNDFVVTDEIAELTSIQTDDECHSISTQDKEPLLDLLCGSTNRLIKYAFAII